MYGPTTDFGEQLHAMKYRQPGETFRDAMNRIATALTDERESYMDFREILLSMRFMPAGRIQAAVGAVRRTTPYNCYVSGIIPDSFVDRNNDQNSSIMHRAEQAAATMRLGGGIGYDFSTLRPNGALIKTLQSTSSGVVPFMKIFDHTGKATSSAGHRRGAQMGVLRIDHPDIPIFVNAKHDQDTLSGFNISVAVTDQFMEHLETGKAFPLVFGNRIYTEIDPQALWETIMRSTWDWGEPGVLFIDQINRLNNLWYCETLAATNPCFTGDTKVWTDHGHFSFRDLVGKTVNVLTQDWSGKLVYRPMSAIRITQKKAKLVEVKFIDGQTIRCTPEHMFFLRAGGQLEASRLQAGMSIASVYRYKANSKGYKRLSNGLTSPLEHHIPFEDGVPEGYDVHHKDEVKTNNWSENLELLPSGEHRAHHMQGDRNPMRRFPEKNHFNDRDNNAEANGNWRSDISTQEILELREAGWTHKAIAEKFGCAISTVKDRVYSSNHTVESVTVLDYVEDVYCGSVDEFHRFFVALGDDDGVLVHNCGEQPLPPFGACLLGSFNLIQYVRQMAGGGYEFDWENFIDDIPVVVEAMDNVIDVAIYPLVEQEAEAKNKRRMGLGYTALANAAETLGFPYGSQEFLKFQEAIGRTLMNESYRASALLASSKGSFPLYDAEKYLKGLYVQGLDPDVLYLIRRYGIRNSHLTSIAPTGTISMAADNVSSGAEPVFSLETQRPVNTPDGQIIATLQDYAFGQFGTLPKLAETVSIQEHLDVLVTAQKYVDSAVSKTCNVSPDMDWEEFKGVYKKAFELGCKGLTTFNPEGKRMTLLKKASTPKPMMLTPSITITPIQQDKNEDMYNLALATAGEACTFDPATGRKSCE